MKPPLLETIATLGVEPVSLEEAKLHLRETGDEQDALIAALISVARENIEQITGRALVRARKRMKLWDFVDDLPLRPIPVVEIEAYEYLDSQTATWELIDPSVYELQTSDDSAAAILRVDKEWPSGLSDENYPVRIVYVVGPDAGSPEVPAIPMPLKQAILLALGDLYENREAQTAATALLENATLMRLVRTYKLWSV